ncbi:MAG: hypothetical protein KIT83_01645 [Bryobacterales bacterium]|nr:hypothetical protein [Bryobacterales bacterium]
MPATHIPTARSAWATRTLPNEILKEQAAQSAWYSRHRRTLLGDYLQLELDRQERIVCANDHFVTLVPFWALWPFETTDSLRRPFGSMPEMSADEKSALAEVLLETVARYDNLFEVSFPILHGLPSVPHR